MEELGHVSSMYSRDVRVAGSSNGKSILSYRCVEIKFGFLKKNKSPIVSGDPQLTAENTSASVGLPVLAPVAFANNPETFRDYLFVRLVGYEGKSVSVDVKRHDWNEKLRSRIFISAA